MKSSTYADFVREMTRRVPVHHLESDWIIRSFVDGLHVSGFTQGWLSVLDILGAIVSLLIFAITCPFFSRWQLS